MIVTRRFLITRGGEAMRKFFDEKELNERIELNAHRLESGDYYRIDEVFDNHQARWPGDKEGRALLAFVSHYKINGRRIECMDLMIDRMDEHVNEHGCFGPLSSDEIFEQQLSGHSWLLRGLCEYYEQFGDERAIDQARRIYENLFLPTKGKYSTYPVVRSGKPEGGVSGYTTCVIDGWGLSSDVGCAFMSIDGLSHLYAVTKDEGIRETVDEMIDVYLAIDKIALKVQTHCTLTAARGMMRMYDITGEKKYLDGARSIYDIYVFGGGMTFTYQNANWWGRNDTWTELCAIVDSLMLALQLYFVTGDESYRTVAARVYHNGFATAQRDNGGAGTDSVVTTLEGGTDTLYSKKYEAYFCCTMRLAEGLWYVSLNRDKLYANVTGEVEKDERGVYMDGDVIYAEVSGEGVAYADGFVEKDGHRLCPLLKYYRVPQEIFEKTKQRVIFK